MNDKRIKQLQTNIKYPLLIKKKENLFYLTGQWFMHGYLLVKPFPFEGRGRGGVVFFGDGLERVEGVKPDRLKNISLYLTKARSLQLEDEFTFAEYSYIKSKIKNPPLHPPPPRGGRRVGVEHIKSPVDFQRQVKDLSEVRLMGKSMDIVAKVFKRVKYQLRKKQWTERGLAEFIKQTGLKLGAEDVSFPPIVASGVNAAIPHHIPSSKKLKAGESIIIDFGFKYKNYCSDFTRTVFLKRLPKRMGMVYNQVEKAYNESIRLINKKMKLRAQRSNPETAASFRKGKTPRSFGKIKARDIYKKAVDVLAEKKLDKYFIHSLGHGAGLEIHELPNLSPESKDILQEGMVFSIEPGVYIPRVGGVRIEDLVYLKNGKARKFIKILSLLKENVINF